VYFLHAYFVRFGRPAPPGDPWRAIAVDLMLFTVFAMHHSLFARTPIKAWMRRVAPPALERSIYTWVASVLFVAVCAAWQPVPGDLYHLNGVWRWAACAVQFTGVVMTVLGARALDVLDLAGVRSVLVANGGAERPGGLVTSGVFGVVRHPLYLGWALLVFGTPDMTATRAVFAVISTLYLALAIPWEERGLVETFGPGYGDYRRHVRWRMVPGIY
jgi:protein-S-isoprenylcysteine O-methyltransferase Ste14